MRAARALLALALALLACRPAAADRELCVRTSPCSAAGGQGALLTRHHCLHPLCPCLLCVPWQAAHGRRARAARVSPCPHDGALTRRPAGSRSTATCMSISFPVRPHTPRRAGRGCRRAACERRGALTSADGARADAQASQWGDRAAFWTWTICSTTSSPSFASASSATAEVCPVPTACRHTARTASLTLGLHTQEKWHLTSSTASITPFPLSSISCPRLRSCLRSRPGPNLPRVFLLSFDLLRAFERVVVSIGLCKPVGARGVSFLLCLSCGRNARCLVREYVLK